MNLLRFALLVSIIATSVFAFVPQTLGARAGDGPEARGAVRIAALTAAAPAKATAKQARLQRRPETRSRSRAR